MKKYIVLRTCHGYKGAMYHKDQRVEFDDNDTPPHHFQLISNDEVAKEVEKRIVDEKMALSQLQRKIVKPLPTAGQVLGKKVVESKVEKMQRNYKEAQVLNKEEEF